MRWGLAQKALLKDSHNLRQMTGRANDIDHLADRSGGADPGCTSELAILEWMGLLSVGHSNTHLDHCADSLLHGPSLASSQEASQSVR